VKIGQYLAKLWTKYDSLLFLGHPVGNYSRRLSADHLKTDRGSRRRKAFNMERATCQSVPASPPTANFAAGAPTVRSVDRDRGHSASTAEPARIRRSLRGGTSSVESPEAV